MSDLLGLKKPAAETQSESAVEQPVNQAPVQPEVATKGLPRNDMRIGQTVVNRLGMTVTAAGRSAASVSGERLIEAPPDPFGNSVDGLKTSQHTGGVTTVAARNHDDGVDQYKKRA